MSQPNSSNPDLESFRNQWLSDLRRRNENETGSSSGAGARATASHRHHHHAAHPVSSSTSKKQLSQLTVEEEWDEHLSGHTYDGTGHGEATHATEQDRSQQNELVSALDHYEKAMEKEAMGSLGDSLSLYRKAYRLDDTVDRTYRMKHFPAGGVPGSKPAAASKLSSVTAAEQASSLPPQAQAKPAAPVAPQSMKDLIASFAHLKIEPVPPEVEGMPQPPCPIANIPDELIIHIMRDVAVDDVGDFVRLAQVCKHFAYLVPIEQRIWRRVCLGDEFGFGGMHHHWQTAVEWTPLEEPDIDSSSEGEENENENDDDDINTNANNNKSPLILTPEALAIKRNLQKRLTTLSLHPKPYPSWLSMFRNRPRLRFNGCYISTVNYIRTGQASTNSSTWNSPIHIVTYYRYLRFYRDGTCVSLLTTSAPPDVVQHLNREGTHAHLPSAVMALALKGRWRLSTVKDEPEREGSLVIETEGVYPKYMYRMKLSLKNAGKSTKSNKLVWGGFWSYNKLTDDWGEFGLKNDKPFFFSRVKSYGTFGL